MSRIMSISPTLSLPTGPVEMSPRLRQTLEYLMDGHSEKQVASLLQISRHTVHVYVKQLHRLFDVRSRAELLSRVFRSMAEG